MRHNIVKLTKRTKKRKNCTSKYKGVGKHHTGKWMAGIRYKKKTHWLGCYETEGEAYKAYCRAAKKLYGEFARLG